MKALALFLFLACTNASFSQVKVRLDTLCENLKIIKQRPADAGRRLLHVRCLEENNDHFLLSMQTKGVWLLLSEVDKPKGRSRIISPKDVWLSESFRIRCRGIEYDYNLKTHNWIKLDNPYDPKTSFGNRDE